MNAYRQFGITGNSGVRSIGLHRFTASINDNGILCLSCQNSPDFTLVFTGNQFGQQQITPDLLSRINSSIRGRCGTEGGTQFSMVITENRHRIDCLDDMSFWIEFSI
jgi:hypothetical protein